MTDEPSRFRGIAGEVVRRFVNPLTLAAIGPVFVVMGGLVYVAIKLVATLKLPPSIGILLIIISSSPVVGRIALAARDGDLDAGLVTANVGWSELGGFVARYALMVTAWGLPVSLLASWLVEKAALSLFGSTVPWQAWAAAALVLFAFVIVAQLLSLLIATKAESVRSAFSRDSWRWAIGRRGSDLVPLVASFAGGLTMFTFLLWPLLGLIAAFAFKVDSSASHNFATFTYLAPSLAAPVLLGRLCGAFVFGEGDMEASKGPSIPHVLKPAAIPALVRLPTASDPPAVVAEPTPQPASAQATGEQAQALLRAGQTSEALVAAAAAIKTAISGGAAPLALELLKAFHVHRDRLELDVPALEALGRQLMTRKELNDAVWCFCAVATRGKDPVRAQKGLIAVADSANRDGQHRAALQIYEFILKKFPDSGFRDFIETASADVKKRLAR